MAQTGYTPILLYVNSTTSTAPSAGNLATGELALNSFSGKLYYRTPAGAVAVIADASVSTAVTSLSFGTTGLTPSTATGGAITVAGTLVGANGGTGQSTYALGDLLYGTASNTLSKLTLGASGYVLTAGASAPAYVAQSTLSVGSATTATNLAGGATGSVPYQTGAGATGMLSIGAAYTIVAANAGASAPTFQTLTSLIDNSFTASAQGTILYRGASGWAALAPSTSGYVLATGGAGADPSWTAAGGAGVTSFQTSLNGLTPSTASSGVVTLAGTLGAISGGTGFTTYATGDIIYASATNTLSKLTAGTNGYVLTLAAGVPTWAAAAGGLTGFTAALNTTSPNNTNNVSSLTASGGSTNQFIALVPKGTGGIVAAIPDGTGTGGNVRGAYAVDLQTSRTSGATRVASGDNSVIVGGSNNTASAQYAFIGGGLGNSVLVVGGTIGGGESNTLNLATNGYATIAGGKANEISNANADYAFIGGGLSNRASGAYSSVVGGWLGTTNGIAKSFVYGIGQAFNSSAPLGGMQWGTYGLGATTTDATTTDLSADTAFPTTTNQIVLRNNSAFAFRIQVVAAVTGGGNSKAWTLTGLAKRGANAAATTLVSYANNIDAADAGASSWTVSASADTTNGSVKITVNGQAATTIKWMATAQTTEVGY